MRPAAHPQTEFTTIMVVPGWLVTTRSTSAAVRNSCTPALVSSSRMGISMRSGYILAPRILIVFQSWMSRAVLPMQAPRMHTRDGSLDGLLRWTSDADTGKRGAGVAYDDWCGRTSARLR